MWDKGSEMGWRWWSKVVLGHLWHSQSNSLSTLHTVNTSHFVSLFCLAVLLLFLRLFVYTDLCSLFRRWFCNLCFSDRFSWCLHNIDQPCDYGLKSPASDLCRPWGSLTFETPAALTSRGKPVEGKGVREQYVFVTWWMGLGWPQSRGPPAWKNCPFFAHTESHNTFGCPAQCYSVVLAGVLQPETGLLIAFFSCLVATFDSGSISGWTVCCNPSDSEWTCQQKYQSNPPTHPP